MTCKKKSGNISNVFSTAAHCSHEARLHWSDNSTVRPRGSCCPWVFLWGNHFESCIAEIKLLSQIRLLAEMKQCWNVYISIFRGPTVQTESMTPLSTPCGASELHVSIEVQYKLLKTWLHSSVANVSSVAFLFSDNTSLNSISLAQLIPSEQNLTTYYRYKGSLTTPGCTEAVIWTLFENPIPLSMDQVRIKDQNI